MRGDGEYITTCDCGFCGDEHGLLSLSGMNDVQRHLHRVRIHELRRRQKENLLTVLVLEARDAGASWGQIGRMLGMSKQAAQKRYDRRLPGM